ncbi:unnamed protein product [Owenia fusiformis]|uniref:Dehydrogenase/reductase SDR family member 1 n=1 Tax=Owenia fusiformis TaxID=6347 RepID=A0A8J1UVJ8_OWEFU|nr:unnamed protein product [Owenia fusiformis]CAH1778718.1 unnamed protein product [Owenia fusiformis]
MSQPLLGKVCVVTGATRGIGKGIALQLGEAGAKVYITGRTLKPVKDNIGGSLQETAEEIRNRGGVCVPVQCDHTKDEEIKALFDKVQDENDGQLDILVNNAYNAVKAIMRNLKVPFWEQPMDMWDTVNTVGLRNHYICSIYAARMMVPRRQGLIVNVSSAGGLRYLFNIPYGVGKEALDRMAVDVAFELRKHNVACVSLWPGAVQTETIMSEVKSGTFDGNASNVKTKQVFIEGESIEYAGKAIVNLASDPKVMSKTGKVLIGSDLADEYNYRDIDGRKPGNFRQISYLLQSSGWNTLSSFVPGFLTIPKWLVSFAGHKF